MVSERGLLERADAAVIEELAGCLERLWSGGGEMGVYTVYVERERLRHALAAFLVRAQGAALTPSSGEM